MHTVNEIADFFIKKSHEGNSCMGQLKLQKLCYYAQGHALASIGKALFKEDFQAWTHGPVLTSLRSRFHDYGWQLIPITCANSNADFSKKVKEVLELVWKSYGKYDGKSLEIMTHLESPWLDARGSLPENMKSSNIITKQSIKSFFSAKFK